MCPRHPVRLQQKCKTRKRKRGPQKFQKLSLSLLSLLLLHLGKLVSETLRSRELPASRASDLPLASFDLNHKVLMISTKLSSVSSLALLSFWSVSNIDAWDRDAENRKRSHAMSIVTSELCLAHAAACLSCVRCHCAPCSASAYHH